MASEDSEPSGAEWGEEVMSGMAEWQTTHPQATFAELEVAVEEHLRGLRERLLERAMQRQARPEAEALPTACPTCGGALVSRGEQGRTVTVPGPGSVSLKRAYQTCPVCGTGLFPPG